MIGTALRNGSSDSNSGTMCSRLMPSAGRNSRASRASSSTSSMLRRLGRAADDVGFDRLGALLFENRRDRAECLHHLARLGREGQMRRQQRPILRQLVGQQLEALVRRQLRVARADAGPGEDLVQRPAVPRRMLANVEREHVQAEDIDLAGQVADQSCCHVRHLRCVRVVGDHGQVAAQLGGRSVNAGGDRRFVMVPIGRGGLQVARASASSGRDVAALPRYGSSRHSDQTRAEYRFVATSEASRPRQALGNAGVAQPPAQFRDLAQIVSQDRFLLQAHRLAA